MMKAPSGARAHLGPLPRPQLGFRPLLSIMFSACRQPLISLVLLVWLFGACNALHFYLDADEQRCFIEEVPTDTVVEGALRQPVS
jgi:hypothetical protein